MADPEQDLLMRVIAGLEASSTSVPSSEGRSLIHQAADAFARKPARSGSTLPTGFDPHAASLFEAVVEASYLVANADGLFDETERGAFEHVVHQVCKNSVQMGELQGPVSDLSDQLAEDGMNQRIEALVRSVQLDDHKREVIRVAALMAHVSGGVAASERAVLDELATGLGLAGGTLEDVLNEVASALQG